MKQWLKKALPWIKAIIWFLVILGVGYQFWKILHAEALLSGDKNRSPESILWEQFTSIPLKNLLISSILYILGIGLSACYWHILLRLQGEKLSLANSARCYYLSQLGKYVPGKGLALFLRVSTAMESAVPASTAAISAVYEVMVTMASGSLLALILGFYVSMGSEQLIGILFLLAVSLTPVLPFIFPKVVTKLARRFLNQSESPSKIANWSSLFTGLIMTGAGWFFLGCSLFVLWHGVNSTSLKGLPRSILECTSMVTIANVGGFVASTPGGLGVREFLLKLFLEPHLGTKVVATVLSLRLLWTLSEVVTACILFWLRPKTGIRVSLNSSANIPKDHPSAT